MSLLCLHYSKTSGRNDLEERPELVLLSVSWCIRSTKDGEKTKQDGLHGTASVTSSSCFTASITARISSSSMGLNIDFIRKLMI